MKSFGELFSSPMTASMSFRSKIPLLFGLAVKIMILAHGTGLSRDALKMVSPDDGLGNDSGFCVWAKMIVSYPKVIAISINLISSRLGMTMSVGIVS